jgi:hypothetical protein
MAAFAVTILKDIDGADARLIPASEGMKDAVGFEDSQPVGEGHSSMKPPPFARVPHPVDIKSISSHAVNAREWRIELFAAIMLHA